MAKQTKNQKEYEKADAVTNPQATSFLFLKYEPKLQTKRQISLSKDIILTAVRLRENQVLHKRGIQYVLAIFLVTYFKGKIETTFLDCRAGLPEGHRRTQRRRLLCLPSSSSRAYPPCCALPCKPSNTPYLLQHSKTAGICTPV